MKSLVVIFFLIFFYEAIADFKEGDQCQIGNKFGEYKFRRKCLEMLPEMLNLGKNNNDCDTSNKWNEKKIVCCPSNSTDNSRPNRLFSRISEKKCKDYQAPVIVERFHRDIKDDEIIFGFDVDCPHGVDPFIVGGYDAKPLEFPHMALIGISDPISWHCGGSLISDHFVLTAAHCHANQANQSSDLVRLGELDYNNEYEKSHPEDYKIIRFISHDKYVEKDSYNDIALIQLDRRVLFSKCVRPACLSNKITDYRKTHSIASGWGATTAFFSSTASTLLKKAVLDNYNYSECNTELQKYKADNSITKLSNDIDNKTQICSGSRAGEEDTCHGDSGGPLQIYHKEYLCMYTIIGITSLSIGPCGNNIPGIYTRVYQYLDWIEKIVWPNEVL